jgi:hypothetical protein
MKARSGFHQRMVGLLAIFFSCNEAASSAEIAVLTPAWSGRLEADIDTALVAPFTMGLAESGSNSPRRDQTLNELAAGYGFDPIRILQGALVDEFASAKREAAVVEVRRQRARVVPLARDEVPENTGAKLMLDITVHYIGIYGRAGAGYDPTVLVDYRWIDGGGALVQATRRVRYNSRYATAEENEKRGRNVRFGMNLARTTDLVEVLETRKDCHFKSFAATEVDPAKFWD